MTDLTERLALLISEGVSDGRSYLEISRSVQRALKPGDEVGDGLWVENALTGLGRCEDMIKQAAADEREACLDAEPEMPDNVNEIWANGWAVAVTRFKAAIRNLPTEDGG